VHVPFLYSCFLCIPGLIFLSDKINLMIVLTNKKDKYVLSIHTFPKNISAVKMIFVAGELIG